MWETQHELAAHKIYSMCSDLGGFFLKVPGKSYSDSCILFSCCPIGLVPYVYVRVWLYCCAFNSCFSLDIVLFRCFRCFVGLLTFSVYIK